MKTLPERDTHDTAPNRTREARPHVLRALTLLLAASLTGVFACAKPAEQTSEQATPPAEEAMLGATSPISLTWNTQDSCVTFQPENTSIHVGDRVNFTTNVADSVIVNIPAGLFSSSDTTIVVQRGQNNTSPTAQALGTYPLSSSPSACATPSAGGGPSIVVDAGDPGSTP